MSITRPHLYCPRLIDHIYQDTNGVYQTCCHGEPIEGSTGQLPFDHYHSDFMTEIRDSMIGDYRDGFAQGCKKCLLQERKKIKSHRQLSQGGNYDNQLRQIFSMEKLVPNPRSIRLKISPFGNHCNLSCSMCHPLNSHKREKELDALPKWKPMFARYHQPNRLDPLAIAQNIIDHAEYVDSIDILGGEPLIHKDHKPFIEMLMDSGKCQHMQIIYTTNCTRTKQKEKLLERVFDYFRSVRIRLSVDDIGKRNEYIRHGSKWSDIEEGIEWACSMREKYNIELRCTRTTQFLNLLSTSEVVKYFNCLDIPVDLSESFVYNPWELCVANLPQELKDQVDLHYDIIHHQGHISQFQKGLSYYLALDTKRGTNILDAFPEFEKYVFELNMDVFFKC